MTSIVRRVFGAFLVPFGLLFCTLSYGAWSWSWMPWSIVACGWVIAIGGALVAADKLRGGWRIAFGLFLLPCGFLSLVAWWPLGVLIMLGGLFIAIWKPWAPSARNDREVSLPGR